MDLGFLFAGMKENYYGRNVVDGKRLDSKFDRALQWKFFKSLVTHYHDQIYFILIHPLVKKAMCQEAAKSGDLTANSDQELDPIVVQTLRRLVPERSHDDHFHVRLKCPAKDTRCSQTTRDLPMTMGCLKKK
jgi:penicillin-insensitive murein endopeptidase